MQEENNIVWQSISQGPSVSVFVFMKGTVLPEDEQLGHNCGGIAVATGGPKWALHQLEEN
jgi:hypothetical protein